MAEDVSAGDIRPGLRRCFGLAFPTLTGDEIPRASTASVAAWDSLAMLTLIALVEEEFNIAIDVEEIPHLSSFDLFEEMLADRLGATR